MNAWNGKGLGWQYIHAHIPYAKLAKAFHSDDKRIELSCPLEKVESAYTEEGMHTPTWVWVMAKKTILQDKDSELLEGVAPQGDMERKIQAFLDQAAAK